jgi:hypothetical protein
MQPKVEIPNLPTGPAYPEQTRHRSAGHWISSWDAWQRKTWPWQGGDAVTAPTSLRMFYIIKTKSAANSVAGIVIPYAGGETPTQTYPPIAPDEASWGLCDGDQYSRRKAGDLYDVIGTAYGGSSAYPKKPDLAGLFVVGGGPATPPPGSAIINYTTANPHNGFSISCNGVSALCYLGLLN